MATTIGSRQQTDAQRALRGLVQRGAVVQHGSRTNKVVEIVATGKRTAAPGIERFGGRWAGRGTSASILAFLTERAEAGARTPNEAEIRAATGAMSNNGSLLRTLIGRGLIRVHGRCAEKVIEIVATGARTKARSTLRDAKPPKERPARSLPREPMGSEQPTDGGRHVAAPKRPAASPHLRVARAAAAQPASPSPPASRPASQAPQFRAGRPAPRNRHDVARERTRPVTEAEMAAFLARGGSITRAEEPAVAFGGEANPFYPGPRR